MGHWTFFFCVANTLYQRHDLMPLVWKRFDLIARYELIHSRSLHRHHDKWLWMPERLHTIMYCYTSTTIHVIISVLVQRLEFILMHRRPNKTLHRSTGSFIHLCASILNSKTLRIMPYPNLSQRPSTDSNSRHTLHTCWHEQKRKGVQSQPWDQRMIHML